MKKFLIILTTLISPVLILALFYVYAGTEVSKRLDIGYGVSTSSAVARLEIGGKFFDIPKNYISSRGDWNGGKVGGVNLQALLPDFEPYTDSNKEKFDKPGSNGVIIILLQEHNIVGSKTSSVSMSRKSVYDRVVYDFVLQKNINITEYPGQYGLTRQTLDLANKVDELYVAHKSNGDFYWVECGIDKPNRFPRCNTYFEYSKYVYIQYSFPKKYLNEWGKIDTSVLSFIGKFEEKSAPASTQAN